jgi:hypothetical protein
MFKLGVYRPSFRVRVSGLPYGTSSTDLMKTFEQYGPTEVLPVQSERGKDLGQSLVSFPSVESAIQAKNEQNGKFFNSRRMTVACDFRGPRIVEEVYLPREPHPRRLIKQVRDKAIGAKWPTDPVMANTNESRMIRRYKTGGLPRSHDRQR